FAAAEMTQAGSERLGQAQSNHVTTVRRHSGTRSVGRQLQGSQTVQSLVPVAEQEIKAVALQPLALPERIVCILHGKIRKIIMAAVDELFVQSGEFALQDGDGPAIAGDVMKAQEEKVLVSG